MQRFGPTRRGGPVFRWLGEPLAIDLANTVMVVGGGQEVDLLAEPRDLRRWLDGERERLGDCRLADAHLVEIRELRDAVRGLLRAAARGEELPHPALERVNAASAAAPVAPQLEAGEKGEPGVVQGRGRVVQGEPRAAEGEPRIVEHDAGSEPLVALLGRLARATIALLAGPDRRRLRTCEAPSCGMLFLERSGRRWCCAACGNRARVARHHRRVKARTAPA